MNLSARKIFLRYEYIRTVTVVFFEGAWEVKNETSPNSSNT